MVSLLVAVLLGDLDWNLVAHLLVVALRVTCNIADFKVVTHLVTYNIADFKVMVFCVTYNFVAFRVVAL